MAFKDVFKTAYPFIAAAASIGGPIGTMAANAVGKALGIDNVPASADGIGDAIAMATSKDPDAMLKLKQAEEAFQLQMTQLGFQNAEQLESIAEKDRESARGREVAVKDKTPSLLAYGDTIGFFGLVLLLCFHQTPPQVHDLILLLLGGLVNSMTGERTYYFGSSAGSDRKTELLAKIQPTK